MKPAIIEIQSQSPDSSDRSKVDNKNGKENGCEDFLAALGNYPLLPDDVARDLINEEDHRTYLVAVLRKVRRHGMFHSGWMYRIPAGTLPGFNHETTWVVEMSVGPDADVGRDVRRPYQRYRSFATKNEARTWYTQRLKHFLYLFGRPRSRQTFPDNKRWPLSGP